MTIEEQGKDPFDGKSGYMERGYISKIDDGVQPYIVEVPDAAVAKNDEKFPLVIFLHGYDPNMNKHRWWEAKDYAAVCARNNCFLAIPFGRLNTDYQSVGEVDVFDVIKEMKSHYRIDPDRVYLVGISMAAWASTPLLRIIAMSSPLEWCSPAASTAHCKTTPRWKIFTRSNSG